MIRFNYHNMTGLTLVELMIAMVLSLVLMGGIFRVLDSNKTAYRVTEATSRVQENGRFALNMLAKDIRATDYWGCLGSNEKVESRVTSADLASTNAITLGNNNGTNSSDKLTLVGAGAESSAVSSVSSNEINVANASGFAVNDIILISNCELGDIVKITAIENNKITVNSTAIRAKHYNGGAKEAHIYPLETQAYSIATGDLLQLNGETLAEGIHNLQIKYAVDTNRDFVPDKLVDSISDTTQIIGMQISLVVRSEANQVVTQKQTYSLMNTNTTATDRKLYQVFSTNVTLRNRVK